MTTLRSILLACLFSLLLGGTVHAQWIQTNGPYSNSYAASVNCFAVSGGNLFAGTSYGGVFVSTNSGTSWTAVDSGLTDYTVWSLAVSDTNLFAGTNSGGVYRSTNKGTSWTQVDSGLTETSVHALAVSGTDLFAGTDGGAGVYRSTNSGTSWTADSNGLKYTGVSALAVLDTNLFGGTDDAIFLLPGSRDTAWNDVFQPSFLYVSSFAVLGTNIFAGSEAGVFLSTNSGASWTPVDSGLTNSSDLYYVNALAVAGTNLFAGTIGGVFLSTNSGTSWTRVDTSFTNISVNALAVSGTNLFAGINASGAWRRPLSEMITSVERLSSDLPMHFSLAQNFPNPFNPTTVISYQLSALSSVSLRVYDILGREVATLVNEKQNAGKYSVTFDGSRLASGVYFYRLVAGSHYATKKLLLLK